MSLQQEATEIRTTYFDWKVKVGDTFTELNLITDTFTGTIVITFKEGNIGQLENKQVFK